MCHQRSRSREGALRHTPLTGRLSLGDVISSTGRGFVGQLLSKLEVAEYISQHAWQTAASYCLTGVPYWLQEARVLAARCFKQPATVTRAPVWSSGSGASSCSTTGLLQHVPMMQASCWGYCCWPSGLAQRCLLQWPVLLLRSRETQLCFCSEHAAVSIESCQSYKQWTMASKALARVMVKVSPIRCHAVVGRFVY